MDYVLYNGQTIFLIDLALRNAETYLDSPRAVHQLVVSTSFVHFSSLSDTVFLSMSWYGRYRLYKNKVRHAKNRQTDGYGRRSHRKRCNEFLIRQGIMKRSCKVEEVWVLLRYFVLSRRRLSGRDSFVDESWVKRMLCECSQTFWMKRYFDLIYFFCSARAGDIGETGFVRFAYADGLALMPGSESSI